MIVLLVIYESLILVILNALFLILYKEMKVIVNVFHADFKQSLLF